MATPSNSGHLPLKEAQRLASKLSFFGSPTTDRFLIVRPIGERTTGSGIILTPNTNDGHKNEGVVVGVGPLDTFQTPVEVGDVVYFGEYSGKPVDIYGFLGEDNEQNYETTILAAHEIAFILKARALPENVKSASKARDTEH